MAKRNPAFERLLQNLERDRNEREVRYANEIVGQTGITRSEALRIARERVARDDQWRATREVTK